MKKVTFQNPVCRGADPWLFTHDGWFYLCCTAGRELYLARTRNPGDMANAERTLIFQPPEDMPFSKNLWSPEIHYFSAEDFGAAHAGWYLYIACDNGENINHRMYVLKCEDKTSPFAPYANPKTGERFIPEKVASAVDPDFNTAWCCGQTILRDGGKVYSMWVDEKGRGTPEFHQRIRLAELENPYTAKVACVICRPTEEWEMHGFFIGEKKIWPRVVEGGTAVYGDDGKTYVIYSGSGYWTPYYALGQMTLCGDPCDEAAWQKQKTPIFSMSDKVFGCGHASYFKDAAGDRFICYHAYLSPDRTGGRYVFIEPYRIENGQVIIGNGSGKPADYETTVETLTIFEEE
ncbi:MAG: family 43 glycosylhydrolase [Clostridia bacterium]|nr:family 43 glycosylhydrolase [Clostridia bacterium]